MLNGFPEPGSLPNKTFIDFPAEYFSFNITSRIQSRLMRDGIPVGNSLILPMKAEPFLSIRPIN